MGQKYCAKCKQELTEETAGKNKRNKSGWNCYCKECLKTRYQENIEHRRSKHREYGKSYREKNKLRRQATRIKMVNLFGNKCNICKNTYPPAVFDFHHKNPSEKEFQISDLVICSWKRIEKELTKCVMLCANCHRILHYEDGSANTGFQFIERQKNGNN